MLVLVVHDQEHVTLRVPPSTEEQVIQVAYLGQHAHNGRLTGKGRLGFQADRSISIVSDRVLRKSLRKTVVVEESIDPRCGELG